MAKKPLLSILLIKQKANRSAMKFGNDFKFYPRKFWMLVLLALILYLTGFLILLMMDTIYFVILPFCASIVGIYAGLRYGSSGNIITNRHTGKVTEDGRLVPSFNQITKTTLRSVVGDKFQISIIYDKGVGCFMVKEKTGMLSSRNAIKITLVRSEKPWYDFDPIQWKVECLEPNYTLIAEKVKEELSKTGTLPNSSGLE